VSKDYRVNFEFVSHFTISIEEKEEEGKLSWKPDTSFTPAKEWLGDTETFEMVFIQNTFDYHKEILDAKEKNKPSPKRELSSICITNKSKANCLNSTAVYEIFSACEGSCEDTLTFKDSYKTMTIKLFFKEE